MITPPKECPIKLNLPSVFSGQFSDIKFITSVDNFSPISYMLPSVFSSFIDEHRNIASGCAKEM
jgi:hypothetical protein